MDKIVIPDEVLLSRVCKIRGVTVMLAYDLAEFYEIETFRLNE